MKYLIDKYDVYLTDYAKLAIDNLMNQYGIDKDLAITLLEQAWPEEMLYTLPMEQDEQEYGSE
jgi:hypothetical protein